jgi:hypothetical protein
MSSTALSLARQPGSATVQRTPFALVGLGTVLASVAANTLFYFVGSTVVAYDPDFIVLANVSGTIVMTLSAAVVAVLLYAGLRRFTRQPARIFNVISAIVFVLTLIPDFTYIPTVPGASDAQTAILVLMHVIAAAVIVRLLTRSAPARAR